jgi:plastocyanin
MRRRVLGAAFAAALAFPGIAAAGEVTIQAVDGTNTWDKPNVIVTVGDQVNWSFAGTTSFHNVVNDSPNWSLTSAPNIGGPTVSKPFDAVGIYQFVCELHKSSMTGTVDVRGANGEAAAPLPPPPLSEQPYGNDTPPLSVFEVRDTVVPKLDRVKVSRVARGVRVKFRLSEAGKVTVKATRGRSVTTRTVEVAKGTRSITVKGLKAGTYRVQVSAKDLAGNAAKSARRASVTVRR